MQHIDIEAQTPAAPLTGEMESQNENPLSNTHESFPIPLGMIGLDLSINAFDAATVTLIASHFNDHGADAPPPKAEIDSPSSLFDSSKERINAANCCNLVELELS